MNAEGGVEL